MQLATRTIFAKDLSAGDVLTLVYTNKYPSSNPDSLDPSLIGGPVVTCQTVASVTENDQPSGDDGTLAAFDVVTTINDNGTERPGDSPATTNYLAFAQVAVITGDVLRILTKGLAA